MRRETWIWIALISALIGLVLIGMWRMHEVQPLVLERRPEGIMSTSTMLIVVAPNDDLPRGEAALEAAERELRRTEALMSAWLDLSEVSRFNTADVGTFVMLSADVLAVMRAARDAFEQTDGTFDITIGPLIRLWKDAGKRGKLPLPDELKQAREQSSWDLIELRDDGALRRGEGVRVDLGGVAKGYAIDRAVTAMLNLDVEAGVVEVGGDVRVFGSLPDRSVWEVDIRDPFQSDNVVARLGLRDQAVCTSGNYARYISIDGKLYSHILDPRTLQPAGHVPSVTVVAPTAMQADIWATALSVLGESALKTLPADLHVLMLVGGPDEHRRWISTPGFAELLVTKPANLEVLGP
ncbi:MAG: FAD:protein FMN transferase [Myxococcota bacterium]|nr:FAD:protein FMN transferase [Myxococcota bacterium]